MDLLDFEADELYFDQEDPPEVQQLLKQASQVYADGNPELLLLRAYLRSPESLNVLVALNRFYYYQHRLQEALLIAEKALTIIAQKLNFAAKWQDIQLTNITLAPRNEMSWIRLYLFTLKSIGFLNMRMNNLSLSSAIFDKLVALDAQDRIGASVLLDLVKRKIKENNPDQANLS